MNSNSARSHLSEIERIIDDSQVLEEDMPLARYFEQNNFRKPRNNLKLLDAKSYLL